MPVHVQVNGASGPVVGAVAKLQNGLPSVYGEATTDATGHCIVYVPATVRDSGLRIDAPEGYVSLLDFPVVVERDCTLTVALQDVEDLTFKRKTRDQIRAVETNFCNLLDSTGTVQFSPFVVGLTKARQIEWMENELAHGSTHMVIVVDFNGYAVWSHPDNPPTVNFFTSNRGDDFRTIVLRLLHRGLTPIVFLHSGDSYAGADYFRDVCAWWNRHCADLTDQCIFVNGWETRRRGGLSAYHFNEANTIIRAVLGDGAVMAAHLTQGDSVFQSHAPEEADDPWLDDGEPENWYTHCGAEFEILLFQTALPDYDDLDEFGQPKWFNRAIDVAERFLPGGTSMPGAVGQVQRDHNGNVIPRRGYAEPDWFGRGRKGGRPTLVAFECPAYLFIRKQVGDDYVRRAARQLQSFGFEHFGNGRP